MDIVWLIEKQLEACGGKNSTKVVPFDQWEGIKLTDPSMSLIQAREVVHITHNGNIFRNIPTEWYSVVN